MISLRPGWLVALCAGILSVSVWLPWLTTAVDGGGRANAIGGAVGSLALPARFGAGQLIVLLASVLLVAAAMAARRLAPRKAAAAALANSLLIAALTAWYYHLNVNPPVAAAYGFYIGAAGAAGAVGFSVWTLVDALRARAAR
jgi:hypothetical protein